MRNLKISQIRGEQDLIQRVIRASYYVTHLYLRISEFICGSTAFYRITDNLCQVIGTANPEVLQVPRVVKSGMESCAKAINRGDLQ